MTEQTDLPGLGRMEGFDEIPNNAEVALLAGAPCRWREIPLADGAPFTRRTAGGRRQRRNLHSLERA